MGKEEKITRKELTYYFGDLDDIEFKAKKEEAKAIMELLKISKETLWFWASEIAQGKSERYFQTHGLMEIFNHFILESKVVRKPDLQNVEPRLREE